MKTAYEAALERTKDIPAEEVRKPATPKPPSLTFEEWSFSVGAMKYDTFDFDGMQTAFIAGVQAAMQVIHRDGEDIMEPHEIATLISKRTGVTEPDYGGEA